MPLSDEKNIIVEEKSVSPWLLLLNQLKSPLIYVLLVAAIITALFHEYFDTIFILCAVLINTALGFYQEYKAENTLQQLKKLVMPKAVLIINGEKQVVEASELRVGDIVELSLEHQIPADGVLLSSLDMSINEAILTGEAMPVQKGPNDTVYAGTTLVSGSGVMKITAIGSNTKIGAISVNVSTLNETETPLQNKLSRLARYLSVVVVICALAVLVLGLYYGYELAEISTTAVAVAVASIPEGLVITLTVILAVGMQKISRRKAVVRKLLAAETLGSINTICVDKTGTVTEGRLSVVAENFIDKSEGYQAILLSESATDALEIAMRKWVSESSDPALDELKDAKQKPEIIGGIPFSSKHKYTAILAANDGREWLYVFGAPEIVLNRSTIDENSKSEWETTIKKHAAEGRKVIGFGYREFTDKDRGLTKNDVANLTWNGLMTLDDPVRPDISEVVRECESAGIKVKMITGDYIETAIAVATEIGLLPKGASREKLKSMVITGAELAELSEKDLQQRVGRLVLFARTDPIQKLKIVNALRKNGDIVAMTGDGVNDSPALKSADIGVVVNEASDVSKETADMVLLDSNFKTIIHAVEEGRAMFDNIKKVVMYLLAGSFSELILVMGAILLQIPLPITAVQILWVNLVEDALPALSLAFEPKEGDLLNQPPRGRNANILDRKMLTMILSFAFMADFVLFAIFYYLNGTGMDLDLMRTIIFVGVGINSLFYIFACKSLRHSIFTYNPFSNKMMLFSVVVGVLALVAGVHLPIFNAVLDTQPLSLSYWAMLIGLGLVNLVLIEIVKWVVNRGDDRS